MIEIRYSVLATADLARVLDFLQQVGPKSVRRAANTIVEGIAFLKLNPYVGRKVRGRVRRLTISFGRAGYVALYEVNADGINILRIRHQREADPDF